MQLNNIFKMKKNNLRKENQCFYCKKKRHIAQKCQKHQSDQIKSVNTILMKLINKTNDNNIKEVNIIFIKIYSMINASISLRNVIQQTFITHKNIIEIQCEVNKEECLYKH